MEAFGQLQPESTERRGDSQKHNIKRKNDKFFVFFVKNSDFFKEFFREKLRGVSSLLVAGLGNEAITADAIGPVAVKNLIVTRHIRRERPLIFENDDTSFHLRSGRSYFGRDDWNIYLDFSFLPVILSQRELSEKLILKNIPAENNMRYFYEKNQSSAVGAVSVCRSVRLRRQQGQ